MIDAEFKEAARLIRMMQASMLEAETAVDDKGNDGVTREERHLVLRFVENAQASREALDQMTAQFTAAVERERLLLAEKTRIEGAWRSDVDGLLRRGVEVRKRLEARVDELSKELGMSAARLVAAKTELGYLGGAKPEVTLDTIRKAVVQLEANNTPPIVCPACQTKLYASWPLPPAEPVVCSECGFVFVDVPAPKFTSDVRTLDPGLKVIDAEPPSVVTSVSSLPLEPPRLGGTLRLRAGDVVKHGPSGEEWVLAYGDFDRNAVSACGWPESIAKMSDCTLVKAATDKEHMAMLHEWARLDLDGDHRRGVCRRQLQVMERARFTDVTPE